MTRARKQFRPTWDAIRHFVDGQLVQERSRCRRDIENAISKEAKARNRQIREMTDGSEAVAQAVKRLIDRVGE